MAGLNKATTAFTDAAGPSLPEAGKVAIATIPDRFAGLLWYVGSAAAILACLIVCLLVWEPALAFPAAWGKPIGSEVDEWVRWLTVNASWFFDGIKNVVTKVLVTIEDLLLWIPWPVIILGVGLTAWKISGRIMALFAIVALVLGWSDGQASRGYQYPVGRVDGDTGADNRIRQHLADNRNSARHNRIEEFTCRFIHASSAGWNANNAQLCLSGAGHLVLRTW